MRNKLLSVIGSQNTSTVPHTCLSSRTSVTRAGDDRIAHVPQSLSARSVHRVTAQSAQVRGLLRDFHQPLERARLLVIIAAWATASDPPLELFTCRPVRVRIV